MDLFVAGRDHSAADQPAWLKANPYYYHFLFSQVLLVAGCLNENRLDGISYAVISWNNFLYK
jgi:hypothetical protein